MYKKKLFWRKLSWTQNGSFLHKRWHLCGILNKLTKSIMINTQGNIGFWPQSQACSRELCSFFVQIPDVRLGAHKLSYLSGFPCWVSHAPSLHMALCSTGQNTQSEQTQIEKQPHSENLSYSSLSLRSPQWLQDYWVWKNKPWTSRIFCMLWSHYLYKKHFC